MTIINTLKDTEKVDNMHDYVGNSRSNGIRFFLKKKEVDMLEKMYIMMSLFNLHFSYLQITIC